MSLIPIIDLDDFGPEEITVRHTGTITDYYMRNVIDLASIVGTHHVPRGTTLSVFEAVEFPYDSLLFS